MAAPEIYGLIGSDLVHRVTLRNAGGLTARIITFGARLTELHVPDRDGVRGDIVLGHDTLAEYVASAAYFGATCGRYGNRIAEGRFVLEGREHQVDRNEGANHLHGGRAGFDRKIWTLEDATDAQAVMTAVSEDGEMGFPGHSVLRTTYALGNDDRLTVTMEADTTRPTLMNMVHHSYFNLAGQGSGDVLGQHLRLASHFYTPVDTALLATGEVLAVAGTPFDFRQSRAIGQDIAASGASGYDHNWSLTGGGSGLHDCAEAYDPASGRRMTLSTTEPGVQVYTGGALDDGVMGKGGLRLCRYAGFTLETQKFPGTPGFAHFPTCRLMPGEVYRHRMAFHFTTDATPEAAALRRAPGQGEQ